MGVGAVELRNWLLRFRCASEKLRVYIVRLHAWMANSSSAWAAYLALMSCRVVALDKSPGVRLVGIGETLRRAVAKLVMRASGYQAKTSCGN